MNINLIETYRELDNSYSEPFQDVSTVVNYSHRTEVEGIDFFICQDCGRKLFFDNLTEVESFNGDKLEVCQHCLTTKYFYCEECNDYYSTQCKANETHDGDLICDFCLDNYYFICSDCDEIFHLDNSHCTDNGNVCESCLEDYSYCAECESYTKDDCTLVHWKVNHNRNGYNRNYYEDRYICDSCLDSCAFKCNDCDEYFSLEHFNPLNVNGESICESCSENYYCCEGCGDYFHSGDIFSNDNGECFCRDCYREEEEEEEIIVHEPHYEPNYHPMTKKEKRETIGFELEVDNVNETTMQRCFQDNFFVINKEVYLKTDGSIPNGIEIVSQPFSYNFFRSHKKDYKLLLENLSKSKAISYDSGKCGLHIHISRESLSGLGLYKALAFFRMNSSFILGVSFRSEDRFNHWSEIDSDYYRNLVKAKQRNRNIKDTYNGKCCAINLEHSYSYEFRIFNGTLNCDRFIASVQFVILFCSFCQKTSLQKLTKNDFLKFLSQTNRSEYRELKAIMPKMLKKGGF